MGKWYIYFSMWSILVVTIRCCFFWHFLVLHCLLIWKQRRIAWPLLWIWITAINIKWSGCRYHLFEEINYETQSFVHFASFEITNHLSWWCLLNRAPGEWIVIFNVKVSRIRCCRGSTWLHSELAVWSDNSSQNSKGDH